MSLILLLLIISSVVSFFSVLIMNNCSSSNETVTTTTTSAAAASSATTATNASAAAAEVTETNKPCRPCSILCRGVMGLVPTLQCRLCLCLYHNECVGVAPHLQVHHYECKVRVKRNQRHKSFFRFCGNYNKNET